MEYAKLGESDLEVSRVCLGCMGFGDATRGQHSWTVDEDQTRAIMRMALDKGINFFDTAIGYQMGTSEQYVGHTLRDFAKRDEVIVATKFLPRTAEDIAAGVTGQEHIARSLDASLSNLSMDYVDLYIYHMWDYNTPLEEIMEGLSNAVVSGKTRYIGIANVWAWQLEKANAYAERMGYPKFVSVQNHMNLIFREDEREMLPCAADGNIALTPYSALAGGRLSRKPGTVTKRLEEDDYARLKYARSATVDEVIVKRVEKVAADRGVSMAAVAIAWLLTKATSPIVGATKLHHINGAVEGASLKLTAPEIVYLEEPYVPHEIVGVMAQNTAASAHEEHVWETVNKNR